MNYLPFLHDEQTNSNAILKYFLYKSNEANQRSDLQIVQHIVVKQTCKQANKDKEQV